MTAVDTGARTRGRTDTRRHPRTAWVRVLAVALPLCLCAPAPAWSQCPDGTPPPCARAVRVVAPPPNSVAVLYFDNLSRDTADAFLADGLTEEIIIRLGQVPRLAVKSRFEVQRFRGRALLDPATIGRSLGAAYLVTGSVQRAGDRVRMRVELFRSATRAQVWGDVFDKASGDLLTVESDIAEAVATAVTGQLLPAERTRLSRPVTSDPVAYEQFLRGLQAAHNFGDEAALRSAVAYFDRAIARDSGFAAAYAGKAVAWSMLADGYVTPREGYGQTRVAANQALARDSTQALAWAMLANAAVLDLDAHEIERLARRGIALDPHGGWSRLFLSGALWAEGRTDSAISEARRAWQDDSLFTIMSVWYISVLVGTGRLDTAAAMIPRIRAILPPTDADPLEGVVLGARGDWRGAARLLDWRYYGGCYDAGMYVRALLALGDTVAARATVDSMVAARTPGYYNPVALARAYAALGDIDRGIEWLRRAFEERTAMVMWVRQDPELATLRTDPRFAALDRRLRF
jgi:TolB-like protein